MWFLSPPIFEEEDTCEGILHEIVGPTGGWLRSPYFLRQGLLRLDEFSMTFIVLGSCKKVRWGIGNGGIVEVLDPNGTIGIQGRWFLQFLDFRSCTIHV